MQKQWGCFDIDRKEAELERLDEILQTPDLWQDRARGQALALERAALEKEVSAWRRLARQAADNLALAKEFAAEADAGLSADLKNKAAELQAEFAALELFVLFTGEWDARPAIVSISAGAGGTDAQDWAEMILAMLTHFCERQGWSARLIDKQPGQEAGIKSATFEVAGDHAYGHLKSESGVHRLVRISPYDAAKMRHTSFALVDVIPDLGDLEDMEIKEEDLRIDVFRSSGHGGQSVNTTDSAVRLVHIPTGLAVSCQNERSQHQNKATALKILKSRLAKLRLEERDTKERRIRGEVKSAEWGSQIRSYVLHPYKLVKDHRTGLESQEVDKVLSGELNAFSQAYLRWLLGK